MPDFRPLPPRHFRTEWRERQLQSFHAQSCEWGPRQRFLLFGETVSYRVQSTDYVLYWLGHLTTKHFVLEAPEELTRTRAIAGAGTILGNLTNVGGLQLLGNLLGAGSKAADTITEQAGSGKFIAVRWRDISYVARDEIFFWPVLKGADWEGGIPFIPHRVDGTGEAVSGWLESCRADEFAQLVGNHVEVRKVSGVVPAPF